MIPLKRMTLLFSFALLYFSTPLLAQDLANCSDARQLLANYEYSQAEAALLNCLEQNPEDLSVLQNLAHTTYQLGKTSNSKNYNEQIIELDSNNRKARMDLAKLHVQENQLKLAQEQYRYLIQLDSNNAHFQKKYAALAFKTGDVLGSLKHYNIAFGLNRANVPVCIEFARVNQEIKNYKMASNLLIIGLMYDSSNVQLRTELAKLYYRTHQYEDVVYQFEKIFEVNPDTSLLQRKMLGVALFQIKDYENSLRLLSEVIENSDDNEVVHYYIAQCYKSLEDYENSRLHFEKAIQEGISKNISNYYTQMALVYEEEGEFPESIKAYQKAYSYSQEQVILYHLARNYDAYYKDKGMAMRYYEKFLSETDSNNLPLQEYSASRLIELKEVMHFDLDTLAE